MTAENAVKGTNLIAFRQRAERSLELFKRDKTDNRYPETHQRDFRAVRGVLERGAEYQLLSPETLSMLATIVEAALVTRISQAAAELAAL